MQICNIQDIHNFYTSTAFIWYQPSETCALESIAKMVLHSEHRNRPGRGAFNLFAQIGHEKIFGKRVTWGGILAPLLLKNSTDVSNESWMVKKLEKPSNWNTSYTFGWRLNNTISPPFPLTAFKNAVNEPIPVEET